MHHEPVFDMYGIAPPDGDWAYEVDDFNVTFGPGWWPFYRDGKPSSIRLAPDTQFLSWRNEYVVVFPGQEATANAKLHLYVRKQGLGAITMLTWITFDLRTRSFQLNPGLPEHMRTQAEGKAQRIADLLKAARAARRAGATAPITAHDRHGKAREAK